MIVRRFAHRGLLRDDQGEADLLDRKAVLVDDPVGGVDCVRLIDIQRVECCHRQVQFILDTAAHQQNSVAQVTQLLVEVVADAHVGSLIRCMCHGAITFGGKSDKRQRYE